MAHALVLGATGHIGSHIVRALLAEGHTVRAGYRNERSLRVLDGLPVERVRVDLDNLLEFQEALGGCDWVFHAAGYYPRSSEGRQEAIDRGIRSARRFFEEVARARLARVVFTSSAATIRAVPGRSANELDAETWPLSHRRHLYSTVKIAMEHEALRAASGGIPIVITNPSLCIGEFDARPFSGRAVLAFAKHRLPWYTDTWLNVVYTGDVGVGHVRAAERGRIGERYLLTGRNVMLREFGAWVAREAGFAPPRWRIPFPLAMVAASAAELVSWFTRREPLFTRDEVRRARSGYPLDGSKAVRELAMPRTPIPEAIRRAVGWFREVGIL